MSLVYVVQTTLPEKTAPEYFKWLTPHVREVLDCPGFLKAEIFEVMDHATLKEAEKHDDEKVMVQIRYFMESEVMLESYLTHYAPRLRDAIPASIREVAKFERWTMTLRETVQLKDKP